MDHTEHIHVHIHVDPFPMGDLMAQFDDLRSALGDVSREVGESATAIASALDRIEAKINELGEPDPDLTDLIAEARSAADSLNSQQGQLDSVLAAPPTDTGGGDTGTGEPPVDTGGDTGTGEPPVDTGGEPTDVPADDGTFPGA